MSTPNELELKARSRLRDARRIVVKVGTSTLTYADGAADLENLERICRALANQMNQGKEMILVSSGAIAIGMRRLREDQRPTTLPEKQAMAAIGQADLMNLYSRILSEYGHIAAQILLTKDDVDSEDSRFNIENTFRALLAKSVLPIVNENDTVSTREVLHNGSFGDNDTLSAIVAEMCEADALILFSDIDGLYDADPHVINETTGSPAKMISYIEAITPEIEALGGRSAGTRGTGGMQTKLQAAKVAMKAGIDMVITQGHRPGELADILEGEAIGSFFSGK